MKKLKNLIKEKLIRFNLYKSPYGISYAQAGEDVVLDFLLKGLSISKPSYLELGVHSPDVANNTYLFYTRGARGVLVEADSSLVPYIQAMRPDDVVLNVGVGTGNENEADFYIFDVRGLNTFDKEEAEYRHKNGSFEIQQIVKVKLLTINEIILNNFKNFPDFLSIDIEGLDLPVLKTLDFEKFPIPIICAETCTYSENHIKPKNEAIMEFMKSKGYFVYADTYVNTIFVNETWFYNNN